MADILAMNVVEPLGDAKCYFDALCVDGSVVSQIVLKVRARFVFSDQYGNAIVLQ